MYVSYIRAVRHSFLIYHILNVRWNALECIGVQDSSIRTTGMQQSKIRTAGMQHRKFEPPECKTTTKFEPLECNTATLRLFCHRTLCVCDYINCLLSLLIVGQPPFDIHIHRPPWAYIFITPSVFVMFILRQKGVLGNLSRQDDTKRQETWSQR